MDFSAEMSFLIASGESPMSALPIDGMSGPRLNLAAPASRQISSSAGLLS
jgi:hypothetical protein